MLSLLPLIVILANVDITIAPARTQLVSGRVDLAKACGSDSWIYGCTKFLGEKLTCVCELADGKWRMRASAQFIPYMFLWDPSSIPHERLHIDDIRASLEEHIRALLRLEYVTADECTRAATRESSQFTKRMDDWKRASNIKRHPAQSAPKRNRASNR